MKHIKMENETIDKIAKWGFILIGLSILSFTGFKFWWTMGIICIIIAQRFEKERK